MKKAARPTIEIRFDPRNLWVGVFWHRSTIAGRFAGGAIHHSRITDIYVCVCPMIPLHIRFEADAGWQLPFTPQGARLECQ